NAYAVSSSLCTGKDCKQKITPKAFRERAKETKILLSLNQKNLRHLRCLLLEKKCEAVYVVSARVSISNTGDRKVGGLTLCSCGAAGHREVAVAAGVVT